MGTLYLVATPIGNLEDISLRALRILRDVSLIAAEDTRTTGRLLAHYDIATSQISYHEHSTPAKVDAILDALRGGDVALVSDAGTPGISDPGYELITRIIAEGIPVVAVPGPSAVVAALAVSGLPTDSFLYLGFLPRKPARRRTVLAELAAQPHTLVAFEAPHRLLDSLQDALDALGDRPVGVARELTKLHEETWRGTLSEAIVRFETEAPRGEVTLVIGGAPADHQERWSEDEVREALLQHLGVGMSRSAAARAIAQWSGWSRREVYQLDLTDDG
jgi:16S rRNA (cytidine1402-2'-O)-methyltransferase